MNMIRQIAKRKLDELCPGLFDLIEDVYLMFYYIRVWKIEDSMRMVNYAEQLCDRILEQRRNR